MGVVRHAHLEEDKYTHDFERERCDAVIRKQFGYSHPLPGVSREVYVRDCREELRRRLDPRLFKEPLVQQLLADTAGLGAPRDGWPTDPEGKELARRILGLMTPWDVYRVLKAAHESDRSSLTNFIWVSAGSSLEAIAQLARMDLVERMQTSQEQAVATP